MVVSFAHLIVDTALVLQQLFRVSPLDDSPLTKNQDLVIVLDCGEPVGNRDDGASAEHFPDDLLDEVVVVDVDVGCGFVN